jgi:hypothetical protein
MSLHFMSFLFPNALDNYHICILFIGLSIFSAILTWSMVHFRSNNRGHCIGCAASKTEPPVETKEKAAATGSLSTPD